MPGFSFAPMVVAQQTDYSVELANNIENTILTAEASNANATLTISEAGSGNTSRGSGAPVSLPLMIDAGARKDVTINVAAQDTEVPPVPYTVAISRASAMDRGELGFMLEMTGIDLTPVPNADDPSGTRYTGEIIDVNRETTISASATADGVSVQSVKLRGMDMEHIKGGIPQNLSRSSTAVATILLPQAAVQIEIVVRRNDMTEDDYTEATYIVDIDDVIVLEDLQLTGLEDGDPYEFDPFDNDYTVMVANDNTTLTVTPRLPELDQRTTYTIFEGSTERAENESASILFNVVDQPKTIRVVLTAPGLTTTYTVIATREASDNANLSVLRIEPIVGDATSFKDLDTETIYQYQIDNPVVGDKAESVRLVAETEHSSAMITEFTIDGTERASAISSDKTKIDTNIDFAEGDEKVIEIKLLAQDDQTTNTYMVTIKQPTKPRYTAGDAEGLIVSG